MHACIYYITRAVEKMKNKKMKREKRKSTWQSICGGDTQDIKMLGHAYVVL